ncbi:Histidinol-phosphate aminotransferase [hydrothermal vent metagenome]|uniref:Histidinol-phosphate aminotransferase n=1 Tax=hydrothermal vent metagenome TaxID=652676 RepID=A0A3B1C1H3_9ZZZZ
MDPDNLIRSRIKKVAAYKVDQTPCPVLLDNKESPYPLPNKLMEQVWVIMSGTELNRYPEMEAEYLKSAIAEKQGASENEILLGNGSDEIIQTLIISLCDPGSKILVPSPTFSMYKNIAFYLNVDTIEAPLNDDWSLDIGATISLIKQTAPKIVFIASPNNPTGFKYSRADIDAVIDQAPGLVVIDEAYIDYSKEPVGLLYKDRPNVAIMRTLSKAGLAALRLGYLMADERLTAQVDKVRLPYNINSVSQAVATEVVKSWDLLTPMFDAVIKERERVFGELRAIDGVTPCPSTANFTLMKIDDGAGDVYDRLIKAGVRVRRFKGHERLDGYLQATVGTPDENKQFLSALRSSV